MPTCTSAPNLDQVIEAMQRPEAYPHVVEAIHVVQTHISCVFLTGRYAYKIKKPVRFDFLDYRALDRRLHFCVQELLLNCRLCPQVYLGVVPLTLQGGRLRVGGSGAPVEWAVRMHQLDATEMLSARLKAGRVAEGEIERIARALAMFHARAAADAPIRAFGAPAVVSETIAGTLHVMDTVAERCLAEDTRRAIRSTLEDFQHREAELFVQRQAEGRTRDCHGDLRLQNICLDPRFDEGLQIFDCIEFNREFRYIDVAADLAYLAMDLDLAGRADLRRTLVETYLKTSGDSDLLRILPFYQIYRACVRGNIALLAAAESEIEASERQAQREIAATAYDLARSYAAHRDSPALLITVGFSGVGKSLLAQQVCSRLPAIHLSSDQIRKELAGTPAATQLGAEHYQESRRASVYEEMRRRAAEYLRQGEMVVLDATFLAEPEREAAARLAVRLGAACWFLECRCPDAVIRRRLKERRQDSHQDSHASDADLAVYEEQLRSYRPFTLPSGDLTGACEHLLVDTDQPVQEAARQVIDALLSARHLSARARHA
jgi:aminoglycoside phosphotransferase family enzyme/predicted kinase